MYVCLNDLANRWTGMVLLLSEASYRFCNYFWEGTFTLQREIDPQKIPPSKVEDALCLKFFWRPLGEYSLVWNISLSISWIIYLSNWIYICRRYQNRVASWTSRSIQLKSSPWTQTVFTPQQNIIHFSCRWEFFIYVNSL